MLVEQGVVRVGMEIEVAAWDNGRTYKMVASDLIDAGYMMGTPETWAKLHDYRCRCDPGGCRTVRTGHVIYPPLVSLTYDASLPSTGGEFVTSPIIVTDSGMEPLKDIWDIVVRDAVWSNKLKDKNGAPCSPSVHLHISAQTESDSSGMKYIPPDGSGRGNHLIDDLTHALSLFAPEFIALASVTNYKRGLSYRKPIRFADQQGHHGFVHVRGFTPSGKVYIEWRMAEAAYDNWEYVESTAMTSALITRAFLKESTMPQFMSEGYSDLIDPKLLNEAVRNDDTDLLLKLVSPRRLEFLRSVCMQETEDDTVGAILVPSLFNRAQELYG
jgi:hypothetical protein